MSSKDVRAFVAEVTDQPGWSWSYDGGGHFRIRNPEGKYVGISSTPSDMRWRDNETARLKRELGYDPEAAKAAKRRRSQQRLQLDRERNEEAMKRAERDAAIRNRLAAEVEKAAKSGSFGEIETGDGQLKGWPTTYRYITVEEALEEINRYDKGCCPRRSLDQGNVDDWVSILETGAFRLTGSAIIYTNCKNKCLANGQHRFWGMQLADQAKLAHHYPNGVPFQVIEEFPPELIHTIDSGKNRSFKNVLELSGAETDASAVGTAVRLAMAYDQSFRENGIPWTSWNKLRITNTAFQVAILGDYATVGDFRRGANRLYQRTRLVRAAGTVLHFLLERDGDDAERVEEFFNGVLGDAVAGDPRREFGQATLLAATGKRKKSTHPAAQQLGMGLLAYARWRDNPGWTTAALRFDSDQKMWPVWKPGMVVTKGELRYPYK